jgi:3-deoxy-7-phosphoheptulonate synthase
MLVIMRSDCTVLQLSEVEDAIRRLGYKPLPVPGANRTAICITGNRGPVDPGAFSRLSGVLECITVTRPYKMVSREVHPEDTLIRVGDTVIGGADPVVIAGPCSVETEARTLEVAEAVKAAGATLFRAGAFKPRTSPYSFPGLGEEALVTLKRVREDVGLPVVSEVLDTESVQVMAEHVDVLQVGTRNMQNFSLLRRLAATAKPILLKRGLANTFDEWLQAAEYLVSGGNEQVILCERGIRTFDKHSRNTLDLNVVPLVRQISHLPIVVDPSHGVGKRDRVRAMSRAAIACGAHGLLIESHTAPDTSYTDAAQTISTAELAGIVADIAVLRQLEPIPLHA